MFKGRTMQVILAQPRGFCAGVERAIDIVETALQQYGPPIYVRHEIVHNPWVVENLKAKGVRFVEQIDQIPNGAITVFSAHGVSERVEQDASMRGLRPLGIVKLTLRPAQCRDAHSPAPLPSASLSARHHQPCRLALPQILHELPGC